MSLPVDIISSTQVTEQIKGLTEQRYKLQIHVEQMEKRLHLIEASLVENEHRAERVRILLSESLALFEEERLRKESHYPDIWKNSLEQALAMFESK